MSALRRDAGIPASPSGSIGYAGSVVGSYAGTSVYEPSEAGTDTGSTAAGRATGQGLPGSRGGRKHYTPSECTDDDLHSVRSRVRREPPQRSRAPFGLLSDLAEPSARALPSAAPFAVNSGYPSNPAPAAPKPRSPPPFAMGGNYEQGFRRAPQPPSPSQTLPGQDPDFWSRRDADARSDVGSIAESQVDINTARDRSGHGNILTWGSDSRQITPTKKRQGRQLAEGPDGLPKAHVLSSVFPPTPSSNCKSPGTL